MVVLSGCDLLSPTLYIRDWLESHTKAKVLYNATAAHGAGLLLNQEWQQTVLQNVMQLVESPSSAAAVAVGASSAGQAGVHVSPGTAAEPAAVVPSAGGTGMQNSGIEASKGASRSSSSNEQLMDPYDTAVDLGCAFDGDEFIGDEFDAMFGNFWGLPEGLSSISSTAGNSLAEMFDAVDIDRLWEAAASATNSLVAGVVSVVKSGSDIASCYASYGSVSMLHQRHRGEVVGTPHHMGQSCKGDVGSSSVCDQHSMIKCQ